MKRKRHKIASNINLTYEELKLLMDNFIIRSNNLLKNHQKGDIFILSRVNNKECRITCRDQSYLGKAHFFYLKRKIWEIKGLII